MTGMRLNVVATGGLFVEVDEDFFDDVEIALALNDVAIGDVTDAALLDDLVPGLSVDEVTSDAPFP